MATDTIADALHRVKSVLTRRPEVGVHADSKATVRWDHGLSFVADHDNGTRLVTDMPREMGGHGAHVTPGWLLRAGLAACTGTRIVMNAVLEGIALDTLELSTTSESDVRAYFGMRGEDGALVSAVPRQMCLVVRIASRGVSDECLRSLVLRSHDSAPVSCALQERVPIELQIECNQPA